MEMMWKLRNKYTHVTFSCWDASSLDIARTNSITHSFFMFVRWNHKNKRETHNTSTDFQMRSIHSLLIVLCINFRVCCRLNDIHSKESSQTRNGKRVKEIQYYTCKWNAHGVGNSTYVESTNRWKCNSIFGLSIFFDDNAVGFSLHVIEQRYSFHFVFINTSK